MIDLPQLAERLQKLGLLNKTFFDCTKEEIEALCSAVMSSVDNDVVPPEGWAAPSLRADGTLHIPFDSHPAYHWWKPGAMSVSDILLELDAPHEVAVNYFRPEGPGGAPLSAEAWAAMKVPF